MILERIFYIFFKRKKEILKNNKDPFVFLDPIHHSYFVIIMGLLLPILFNLYNFIDLLIEGEIFNYIEDYQYYFVILTSILFLVPFYFLFERKNRYVKIEKYYDNYYNGKGNTLLKHRLLLIIFFAINFLLMLVLIWLV